MTAPNYLANYNAYQSALQTKDQAIATAQSVLDQARASLTALVAQARPEDVKTAQAQVENAKGALEVAEASYRNNVITAPISGTITAVNIAVGQIAIANAAAIEITHDTLPH
jgi:HlyD family secretion protein